MNTKNSSVKQLAMSRSPMSCPSTGRYLSELWQTDNRNREVGGKYGHTSLWAGPNGL